jgi:hypothetical protein
MRRIGLIGLALTAICAFGGMTASASMASFCVRVEEPGQGNFLDSGCGLPGAGSYIPIQNYGRYLGRGQWCAEVEAANTGNRTDAGCVNVGRGNFIIVYERPDWFVGGIQLKQGVRQMKWQVKGTPILSATFGEAKVVVECNRSVSEGATIEGQGNFQGQGKGRLTFTSCKVAKPEKCTVAEPITTVQTKAHLASFRGQSKIAVLFEPTEGKTYVTLKFSGSGCGVIAGSEPVTGTVAAEAIPTNVEGQEGLLNFPEQAIKTVSLEGQERSLGLSLGGQPTVFSAAYGVRLASGESFGAFGLF